ncbi:hypothetical protein LJC00_00675 [Dysgonomonas sp. OttesenSCG-928-M03]|nr:hypothetical protein [Dysgonomonas sp. OttesenSCG-928-M03]
MKFTKLISWMLIIAGIVFFNSCNDEDGNHINSAAKLLPSKITTEYEGGNKRIYTYQYDDDNRLAEYREISYFGNNVSLEDMETICKITYSDDSKIDSLIIIPQLLDPDKSRNITSEISSLVNDTILFEYEGQIVTVKYRNKEDEQILINSKGEVTAYKYYAGINNLRSITNTFEYDNKGNITKTIRNNGIAPSLSPYTYIYDKRNGIFRNMDVPQWFLVIMLNIDFNLVNNYQQYTDYEGGKWAIEYEYNNDDYPEYSTTKYSGASKIRVSEAPTTYEYIIAK